MSTSINSHVRGATDGLPRHAPIFLLCPARSYSTVTLALLAGHPDIAEVAIIGLPDPRTGERACAVIVPKRPPGPDVGSLRGFLEAQGVAPFKTPEQVVIWNALPKNDAGKILKTQIRAALSAAPTA